MNMRHSPFRASGSTGAEIWLGSQVGWRTVARCNPWAGSECCDSVCSCRTRADPALPPRWRPFRERFSLEPTRQSQPAASIKSSNYTSLYPENYRAIVFWIDTNLTCHFTSVGKAGSCSVGWANSHNKTTTHQKSTIDKIFYFKKKIITFNLITMLPCLEWLKHII